VLDDENRLTLLNESARKAFSLPEAKVAGRAISELIDDEELVAFMSQPASAGTSNNKEIVAKDGQTYNAKMDLIKGGGRSIQMHRLS
jgi:hypothetical protein